MTRAREIAKFVNAPARLTNVPTPDLTNLNASNLTSGTIPNARISSGSVTQHVSAVTNTSGSWTPAASDGGFSGVSGHYHKTGNICIEIERRGKPTGLSITKAKVWVHVLAKGDKQLLRLVIDVPVLKKLAEKFKDNWKMGGDRRETKPIMIPFNKIIYEITNDN